MKPRMFALIAPVIVATPIALAATAHADYLNFQSPSGNIYCILDPASVSCDIKDYTYQPPPPPECAQHVKWGNRFSLERGKPGTMVCHGDTLRVPNETTLNYGQKISAGTLTCASEESGMKCTDSGTGHYFRVSKDSFDLG
jgi:hypothetical protein